MSSTDINTMCKTLKKWLLTTDNLIENGTYSDIFPSDHEEVNSVETGYDFKMFCKHDKEPFYFGKEALLKANNEGVKIKHVGIKLLEKGIPRADYDILTPAGEKIGYMVNGVCSPVIGNVGFGMAYIDIKYAEPETEVLVQIRKNQVKAKVVKLPFYDPKKWGWRRKA